MAEREKQIAELESAVLKNPAAPEFLELAKILIDTPSSRSQARDICFRALKENPKHKQGRLLLARLFYLDGMWEFAVRELLELRTLGTTPALEQLLNAFSTVASPETLKVMSAKPAEEKTTATPNAADKADDDVMAELDIDTDFLEALDELEDKE